MGVGVRRVRVGRSLIDAVGACGWVVEGAVTVSFVFFVGHLLILIHFTLVVLMRGRWLCHFPQICLLLVAFLIPLATRLLAPRQALRSTCNIIHAAHHKQSLYIE